MNSALTKDLPICAENTQFISRADKLLIGGKWVPPVSGKTFATYNPADGSILTRCAEGDVEDIHRAVSAARQAFDHGP